MGVTEAPELTSEPVLNGKRGERTSSTASIQQSARYERHTHYRRASGLVHTTLHGRMCPARVY